jgi:hypothetical protein
MLLQGRYSIKKNKKSKQSDIELYRLDGRSVAQRLDAGFPPRRPGFAYGQHVGFVVDKAALGQVDKPCQDSNRAPRK